MMNKFLKIFGWILLGIVVIFGIVLLIAYLVYPPEFVNRMLRWGDADVYDYQKFPERLLETSDTPFEFAFDPDEASIRSQFEFGSGIDDLDTFLADNDTQAFIVIQDDTILYEKYFNRASRDSIVTSFSTAKSFTSALVGIAIAEGTINSEDDPITKYLPELAERDPAFANITIRDLLMMSSGIKYSEPPDNATTYYYPDLRQLALEKTKIIDPSGEYFHYNNFHPLLLGMILERATGTTVANYLQEKIWKPIGMQYPGSWSLDEAGFEKMESGINGRALDFAKFGRLYLRNGNWDGVQVIPEAWVAESTQADTSVDYTNYYYDDFIFSDGQGYYKYLWWGIQRDDQNYDFMALGNKGQFIYISPQTNLIILRFGENYGEFGSAQGWVDLFYNYAIAMEREP
ncbi:serine hydrolase domain-containing protein [Chloroflexota bacterium]